MKNQYFFVLAIFLIFMAASPLFADGQVFPDAFAPEAQYNFEPQPEGSKIIHEFIIKNRGEALLKIERVKTG